MRLALCRHVEAEADGFFARFRFLHSAERQKELAELIGRELGKGVALILCRRRAKEVRPVVTMFESRVMAGCYVARSDPARIRPKRPEFHEVVAGDAGVRRAARSVFARKPVDDRPVKRLLEVEHVMRDPERRGTAPCIVEIIRAAA